MRGAGHLQLHDGEETVRVSLPSQFFHRCRRALAPRVEGPPAETAVRRVFEGLAQEAMERRRQREAMGLEAICFASLSMAGL